MNECLNTFDEKILIIQVKFFKNKEIKI